MGLKVADVAERNLKISYDLGELKLGKLDKEYFNDPDLESILQGTELDTEKMRRFENEELYLIDGVIYSERFELKGKRQSEVTMKLHSAMFGFSVLHQINALVLIIATLEHPLFHYTPLSTLPVNLAPLSVRDSPSKCPFQ